MGHRTAEPDVGDLRLRTRRRTSREVHPDDSCILPVSGPARNRPGPHRLAGQLLVQESGPLDGALFGLDDGVTAEFGPRACHHAPGERAGKGRVLLQKALGQQIVEPLLGHAGQDEVLIGSRPHGAVAIGLGQPGHLDQLQPRHPTDRHRATHVHQARLLLGVDAYVVAAVALGQVLACGGQLELGPFGDRLPESLWS